MASGLRSKFRREIKSWRRLSASGSAVGRRRHIGCSGNITGGGSPESIYMNLYFGQFAGWHSHMDLFNLNLWRAKPC